MTEVLLGHDLPVDTPFSNGQQLRAEGGRFIVQNGPGYIQLNPSATCMPLIGYHGASLIWGMVEDYPAAAELFSVESKMAGEKKEQLTVLSLRLPTARKLNEFKAERLAGLGATDWQFGYHDWGDGISGEFSSDQVVQAMAQRRFLLSSDSRWIIHDSRDHALAQACLPKVVTDIATLLAQHIQDLKSSNPILADKLGDNLADAMDLQTEFQGALSTESGHDRGSYVLTALVQNPSRRNNLHLPNSEVIPYTRDFLTAHGVEFDGDDAVWEQRELPAYYEAVFSALSAQPAVEATGLKALPAFWHRVFTRAGKA